LATGRLLWRRRTNRSRQKESLRSCSEPKLLGNVPIGTPKIPPAVLGKVKENGELLFLKDGAANCRVFKEALDWVGRKTGVPAYA